MSPWNDDSWRDGYDAWKLASPYDDYDDYHQERDCEHEDYDIDVCTGRASCNCCSYQWYLSNEEIDAELDRQARYDQDMKIERRRAFWRDLTYPIRWRIFRVLDRIWPRKAHKVLLDEEIPF